MPRPPIDSDIRLKRPWSFNARDLNRVLDRCWHLPVSALLQMRTWARLWAAERPRKPDGLTSLLPVLAIHAAPGLGIGDFRTLYHFDPQRTGWAAWTQRSSRRLALLSGVAEAAVPRMMELLAAAGLIDTMPLRTTTVPGWCYRVRLSLIAPEGCGVCVRVPAALFYSGLWQALPTHAARHVYLVLAALGQDWLTGNRQAPSADRYRLWMDERSERAQSRADLPPTSLMDRAEWKREQAETRLWRQLRPVIEADAARREARRARRRLKPEPKGLKYGYWQRWLGTVPRLDADGVLQPKPFTTGEVARVAGVAVSTVDEAIRILQQPILLSRPGDPRLTRMPMLVPERVGRGGRKLRHVHTKWRGLSIPSPFLRDAVSRARFQNITWPFLMERRQT